MIIKCKMCGGDMELIPNETVAECVYCGSRQTVPNADNEKKMTLFARANRLRYNCEFDKGAGVYETIVAEYPEEAEAYWGLVLCKYGIEYVDDPATARKVPTCHRSSFESVMEDDNLELALEYADAVAKRVYREEAKQIEDIRKNIVEVSAKEEPYDVFICYKETDEQGERTIDSVLAQDIYTALTEKGYRVFFSRITLEDKLGEEYEPYIFAALHSARLMLAVGTSYEHYDAVWVKNEWSRYLKLIASGEKKALIPCYKNVDAYDMPKEFAKLQAQDMGKVGALQDLMRGVEKILGGKTAEKTGVSVAEAAAASGMSVLNAQTEALLKRGYMALEDGDFQKATDFFEQVLNNDAECGRAYLGKVYAANEVENAGRLAEKISKAIKDLAMKEGETKNLVLPLVALAREADAEGVLSGFSEEELKELLEDEFDTEVRYLDELTVYERLKEKYRSIEQLREWITDVSDFGRAVIYADDIVQKELAYIQNGIAKEVEEERIKNKEYIAKSQASYERRKKNVPLRVAVWLEVGKEELRTRTEMAYQAAVEEWKAAKEAYVIEKEKREMLQKKIEQREQEKAGLTGFFTGKRRKELEEKIRMLQAVLSSTTISQEPGEEPVYSAPQFADVLRDVLFQTITFGTYPYEKDGTKRAIEWIVLEKKEDKALILSKYGLDVKPYHKVEGMKEVRWGEGEEPEVTWEESTIRSWLNREFVSEAFSEVEQSAILETEVDNSQTECCYFCNTSGGDNVRDKVFLLSYGEVFDKYFLGKKTRICMPTVCVAEQCRDYIGENGACQWWLRSPGDVQSNAICVYIDGSLDIGYAITNFCIRPALWIDLNAAFS